MAFKDQSFNHRLGAMGDEAESVFEAAYPNGYVRTGLCRPPIQVHALPIQVRYIPDYLTSNGWVEVQGFGRDQTVKLKMEKYQALIWWSWLWPVSLFLWDKTNKRYTILELSALPLEHANMDVFPEGKEYLAIPADAFDGWTPHNVQT